MANKKKESRQSSGARAMRGQLRMDRLASRRDRKFKKHHIGIENTHHTEVRKVNGQDKEVMFTHAVFSDGKLIGRTHSKRSAYKRAHQYCRSVRG